MLHSGFTIGSGRNEMMRFSRSCLFFCSRLRGTGLVLRNIVSLNGGDLRSPRIRFFFGGPLGSNNAFYNITSLTDGCNLMPVDTRPRACSDGGASGVDHLVDDGLHRCNLRLHGVMTRNGGPTTVRTHGARVLTRICRVLDLALNRPIGRFACTFHSGSNGRMNRTGGCAPGDFCRRAINGSLGNAFLVIVGSPHHPCRGACRMRCSHRACSNRG